jgi:hypothetical protein
VGAGGVSTGSAESAGTATLSIRMEGALRMTETFGRGRRQALP